MDSFVLSDTLKVDKISGRWVLYHLKRHDGSSFCLSGSEAVELYKYFKIEDREANGEVLQ